MGSRDVCGLVSSVRVPEWRRSMVGVRVCRWPYNRHFGIRIHHMDHFQQFFERGPHLIPTTCKVSDVIASDRILL